MAYEYVYWRSTKKRYTMRKKLGEKKDEKKKEETTNIRPYSELKAELAAQGIDADKMVLWLMGFGPFDADLSLDEKPEEKKDEEGDSPPPAAWKKLFWCPPVSSGDYYHGKY